MISHQQNRPEVLAAIVIRDLNHANRIRHLQKLPRINFDPLEVERLSIICRGLLATKQNIINFICKNWVTL